MGQLPLRAALALAATLVAGACGGQTEEKESGEAPPRGLAATLTDETREADRGRIAWTTTWELCWEPVPGAEEYELEALTGEGASPELVRTGGRCFALEAAAGENAGSEGLRDRDALLALAGGQLGYRVRAVLGDGQRTEWSEPVPVGETRP